MRLGGHSNPHLPTRYSRRKRSNTINLRKRRGAVLKQKVLVKLCSSVRKCILPLFFVLICIFLARKVYKPSFPSSYFGSSTFDAKTYSPLGGHRFSEYKDGSAPYRISKQASSISNDLADERKKHVEEAMKHAWEGYTKYAYGYDELEPLAKRGKDSWGGIATTLVDSLDTLWIMGMKDEFYTARDWIGDNLDFKKNVTVSVFETTIRSLGGLLSAYDLSGEKVFLEKAEDLGQRLLQAFTNSSSGLPYPSLNLLTGVGYNSRAMNCPRKYSKKKRPTGRSKKRAKQGQHFDHPETTDDDDVNNDNDAYEDAAKEEENAQGGRKWGESAPESDGVDGQGFIDGHEAMQYLGITNKKHLTREEIRDVLDSRFNPDPAENDDGVHHDKRQNNPGFVRPQSKSQRRKLRIIPSRSHSRSRKYKRNKRSYRHIERGRPSFICAFVAEAGTLQIEFRFLAKATGKTQYKEKVEKIYDLIATHDTLGGLYPNVFRGEGDKIEPSSRSELKFGGTTDSFYEYMLKQWLQGNKREEKYRTMYDKSINAMHEHLLVKSKDGLLIIGSKKPNIIVRDTMKFPDKSHNMEHLTCFMGGLLALGAYTDPNGLSSSRAQRDLKTARAVTYTCYQMYARTATGLSPEIATGDQDSTPLQRAEFYYLRPEAVESFYILYTLTGDPVYREWGWEVFQSIEKYCKTKVAYSKYANVNDPARRRNKENNMESFFLAETLKYLYLLFDTDPEVDLLHKHVFNTEAHPLRIFNDD